jgi:5-methylcytosine-specific restriction endonuclease McrA
MTHNVLKLNADWQPIEIISWRRAIELWWVGSVEIVKSYDDFDLLNFSVTLDHGRTFSGKCPAVVRLLTRVGFRRRPKYNRANILKRDNFTCQYCGYRPGGTNGLNLDHVIPKSRGGAATWENIVTACVDCNGRKRNRTPHEARMILKTTPKRPSEYDYMKISITVPKTPTQWREFCYWHQELENDND